MLLKMLKGKVHRAVVTEADLNYEGSIGIDEDLMEASGIITNEHVEVYNITNGARFTTYAIPSPRGSGRIFIYGAAAHLAKKGHLLIICSYTFMKERKAKNWHPKVVLVDKKNRIKKIKDEETDA